MATIYLNVEDNASEELEAIEQTLLEVGETSADVAQDTAKLTDEQQRQITVIHEQRTAYSTMASTAVSALGQVTAAGFKLAGILAPIHERQRILNALTTAYASASGAVSSALATQTGRWAALRSTSEFAGAAALKAITGLGTPLLGATAGLKAYEMLLARTGERWNEFGERSTNLDRASKAIGSITSELGSNLATGLSEVPEYYTRLIGIENVWQEIDRAVTRGNDNLVTNVGHVRSLAEWMGLASKSTEEFENRVRRTTDDFERLREANKTAADEEHSANVRAAAEADTAHADTLSRIEDELRAQRQKAGELAQQGKFTAEESERYQARINALTTRRTELERAEAEKQRKITADQKQWELEAAREVTAAYRAELDARTKALEEEFERQERITQAAADQDRDIRHEAQDEIMRNVIASLEREGQQQDVIHAAKLRQIDIETQRRIDAAKTADEAIRAAGEGFRRRMREEGDFHRAEMQRQAETRKQKVEAEIEAEKQKHERLKALSSQITDATGIDGKQLLAGVDPRRTQQALQASRRDAAQRAEFAKLQQNTDMDDPEAVKRLKARVTAAGDRASAKAAADFRAGKVGADELTQAQNQAGQAQLQALNQSGKLSTDTTKALQQMLQAAAENQQTTLALQQEVARITVQAKQLTSNAQQTRQRAQRNSL